MNSIKSTLVIGLIALGISPLMAQQKPKPVSPRETISAAIDGKTVSIAYGRPYTKDPKTGAPRKIWGGLVPYNKVWRMGANEATTLTTQLALVFGTTTVPAGTYTLYMLPNEDGTAKLIINKQTGQWGTQYSEDKDLARVNLTKAALAEAVNQFTMAIDKTDAGGTLELSWENTKYSVPFTVQK